MSDMDGNNKMLFSERYGYKKPSDVIIKEKITPEILNAICSTYDFLLENLDKLENPYYGYSAINEYETYLWMFVLEKRKGDFDGEKVSDIILLDPNKPWIDKIDLIEITIDYLQRHSVTNPYYRDACNVFIKRLNSEFKRLKFGYRIVDDKVTDITSNIEIQSIETAINDSDSNIRHHLDKALSLYSMRPEGDYENSIKESISAVESYCREKTQTNTLGEALKHLSDKGIAIPPILQTAFGKLYAYTNDPETGIRHALMTKSGDYIPGSPEALYMLVSCTAFINFLNQKLIK
jgi:hypothetical protein